MTAWEAALAGARNGVVIGAATGLVPLVFGLFHRQRQAALVGFVVCVIAGTIGGIYAAIVGMGLSLAAIVRLKGKSKESDS